MKIATFRPNLGPRPVQKKPTPTKTKTPAADSVTLSEGTPPPQEAKGAGWLKSAGQAAARVGLGTAAGLVGIAAGVGTAILSSSAGLPAGILGAGLVLGSSSNEGKLLGATALLGATMSVANPFGATAAAVLSVYLGTRLAQRALEGR